MISVNFGILGQSVATDELLAQYPNLLCCLKLHDVGDCSKTTLYRVRIPNTCFSNDKLRYE